MSDFGERMLREIEADRRANPERWTLKRRCPGMLWIASYLAALEGIFALIGASDWRMAVHAAIPLLMVGVVGWRWPLPITEKWTRR